MRYTLRAGFRTAGMVVMALAIAHCGDNSNDNTTPMPTRTAATATGTPRVTATPTTTPAGTSTALTPTPTPTASAEACPGAISFEADATTSVLDSGWTGLGQRSKIVDKGKITARVTTCEHLTRPCGICNLEGPIPNSDAGNGTSNNQRCTDDTSIPCTTDADCAGAGSCVFFFGAPLPLTAGGVNTCVVSRVVGTITGTANIEAGTGATTVALVSRVFSTDNQSHPCPVCENDGAPEDGKREGTCAAGPREGMSCDVGGESPTFGTTSFDCPPLGGTAEIAALPINLATSTGITTRTLSTDSPKCSGNGFTTMRCMCDTCATVEQQPCFTNADCPAGHACGGLRCVGGANNGAPCSGPSDPLCFPDGGFCTAPGAATKPNGCSDGICTPTSDSTTGECSGGPFPQYCGPHDTFRPCSGTKPCTFPGDTCQGGAPQPCFLDNGAIGGSVTVNGAPDVPNADGVSHPTLGALFCIGPTSGGAVNSAAGLPGLGRIKLFGEARQLP